MLKTVVLYLCGNSFPRVERSKEQQLFISRNNCNIINAFTVTFDQFNASLLNKYKFVSKKNNCTNAKLLNGSV